MSFATWQYIVFLSLALVGVRALKGGRNARVLLLLASCAFYAFFDVRLLPVLVAMAVATYLVAHRVAGASVDGARRRWLVLGVCLDLGVLGLFKYYDFFTKSFASLLRMPPPASIGLVLPVGISFVTFEVLSYLIDVYRGEPESASLLDFTLMVMFFPHLIAGPILKPSDFLPQLGRRLEVTWDNIEVALPGFLIGLVKKVLIADSLARFVDSVFARPSYYSSATVWLAVVAYAIQIYCDFSGYSDMAIASARCFGLEIPANFNMPYLSKSVTEFWRRWHISLSTWFRRYVYIPLGGNRRGLARACLNTMIVMLLSGLWHGAGWNFVVWGGLHGLAMVAQRLFRAVVPLRDDTRPSLVGSAVSWLATTTYLCFAWVFFRAANFAIAATVVEKMVFAGDTGGIAWLPTSLAIALPVVVASHWVGLRVQLPKRLQVLSFAGAFTLTVVVLGVLAFAPDKSSPFIYFQF